MKPPVDRFVCSQARWDQHPDDLLILPWNIVDEVTTQHGYAHDWRGKFAVAVPQIWVLR